MSDVGACENKFINLFKLFGFYLLLFTLSGCEPSAEYVANVERAKVTPKYISNRLTETITEKCTSGNKQAFRNMFDEFAHPVGVLSNEESLIYGLSATYSDLTFTLTNSQGNQIITDRLPAVFFVYNVWIALDKLGDDDVVFIANRTKSTTGLYFLAVYTLGGEKLYRNVLGAMELWDVKLQARGFDIVGSCNTQMIRNKENYHNAD